MQLKAARKNSSAFGLKVDNFKQLDNLGVNKVNFDLYSWVTFPIYNGTRIFVWQRWVQIDVQKLFTLRASVHTRGFLALTLLLYK